MITCDLDINTLWDKKIDWLSLAEESILISIKNSYYSDLIDNDKNISISITLSDNQQLHSLNKKYRHKDRPTNILSFPLLDHSELQIIEDYPTPEILLGDIIISYDMCNEEALEKNISIEHHYQHLIVHGILHLLGYDHIEDKDADIMQSIEIKALEILGIDNPYEKG